MKTRRCFVVGEELEIAPSVEKLGKHFYPGNQIQSVSLGREDAMKDMTNEQLDRMVFLGHSNTHEYGTYHAKAFVKELDKKFIGKVDQKKYVHHLYLVGCDMGLITEQGSLAQSIADHLFDAGFINATVHAIAKPEGSVGESMYVEVITNAGVASLSEGYLRAYLFSQKDGEQFFELLKDKRKNAQKIEQFKQAHGFEFLSHVNPLHEMNKPYHVFMPKETPERRAKRINEHPRILLANDQETAIQLLASRRDYEKRKNNLAVAKKLDFIILQLERVDALEWKDLLKRFQKYFSLKVLNIELNKHSRTLKLLNYLCNREMQAAKDLIAKQDAKLADESQDTPHTNKKKKREKIISNATILPPKKSEATPLLSSSHHSINHVYDSHDSDSEEMSTVPEESLSRFHFGRIQTKIVDLKSTLDTEIKNLSTGCSSFFNSFELETKKN